VVAAQVVQPHKAPLGMLGQRLVVELALCVHEAACERAGLLAAVGLRRQRSRPAFSPLQALAAQPLGEVGQLIERKVAEQGAVASAFVVHERCQRLRHVGPYARGQAQQSRVFQQRVADLAAQPKQALAQARDALACCGGGPQHGGQALGAHRPFEGHHREQRGVLGRQAPLARA
jgi:hypothetical protein